MATERVMADPSLLLSRRGETLLDDPELAARIIVSRAFVAAVAEQQLERFRPFVRPADTRRWTSSGLELIADRLQVVETFSAFDGQDLDPYVDTIRRDILATEPTAGEILADEWVYLATQSWLISKSKLLLTRLNELGAEIEEHGHRLLETLHQITDEVAVFRARAVVELIKEVVGDGNVPEVLTPDFIKRVRVKWVLYVGALAAVGAGGAAVGGPIGGAAAVPTSRLVRPVVRAFDP